MASEPDLAAVAPTEIRLRKDKAALAVTFDNGETYEFPAEFLRVLSPSAEVQGHSPDERKTVGGKRLAETYATRLLQRIHYNLSLDQSRGVVLGCRIGTASLREGPSSRRCPCNHPGRA
jgi:Gamma-butyrobetaine hydroxylase-like, N-terminal